MPRHPDLTALPPDLQSALARLVALGHRELATTIGLAALAAARLRRREAEAQAAAAIPPPPLYPRCEGCERCVDGDLPASARRREAQAAGAGDRPPPPLPPVCPPFSPRCRGCAVWWDHDCSPPPGVLE